VDALPAGIVYLKFDLSGVSAPIVSASLRLACTNGSSNGGTIYPVPDARWVEGTATGVDATTASGPGLTWNTVDTNLDGTVDARDTSPYVPDLSRPIARLGAVSPGQPATADVTAAVQGGPGLYSLAIV